MRISDWGSDVCSSDLDASVPVQFVMLVLLGISILSWAYIFSKRAALKRANEQTRRFEDDFWAGGDLSVLQQAIATRRAEHGALARIFDAGMTEFRSEEHTSELQSLMRISYAVICLKKKKTTQLQHK